MELQIQELSDERLSNILWYSTFVATLPYTDLARAELKKRGKSRSGYYPNPVENEIFSLCVCGIAGKDKKLRYKGTEIGSIEHLSEHINEALWEGLFETDVLVRWKNTEDELKKYLNSMPGTSEVRDNYIFYKFSPESMRFAFVHIPAEANFQELLFEIRVGVKEYDKPPPYHFSNLSPFSIRHKYKDLGIKK
jgi:hypothetical protein